MERLRTKVRVMRQVSIIDGRNTSYLHFRDNFMEPNLPVLISGLMDHWPASQDWITPDQRPNFDFISSRFGTSRVQVADCCTQEFNDQKRLEMTLAEFVAYWRRHNVTQYEMNTGSLLYVKDWHFSKEYPGYCLYTTPELFQDDWLNFYLEHHQLHVVEQAVSETDLCFSDYRFVYMGPKGTWTPLHADVLRSYSWSGNICGRKLWHLLPPSETDFLYDRHRRNTVFDIYGDISPDEFPYFHMTGWHECVQDHGQVLFVPSGWYHQVTNLEDTISINHNWFNGYNLQWVWKLLQADYKEARASIEDIRLIANNFEELCQRNLAANSGMNFRDFFQFMKRMATFFVSFLTQSYAYWESFYMENGFGLKDPCIKFILKRLFSEVTYNLEALGKVAACMVLVQDQHTIEGSRANEAEPLCLSSIWSFSWHSEYALFLTRMSATYMICDIKDCDFICECHLTTNEERQYKDSVVQLRKFIEDGVLGGRTCSPEALPMFIEMIVSYIAQSELL